MSRRLVNVMAETQASITAWADKTFGPVTSLAGSLARSNQELAEAIRAYYSVPFSEEKLIEECADTVICLARTATVAGASVDHILIVDSPSEIGWETGSGEQMRMRPFGPRAGLALAQAAGMMAECFGYLETAVPPYYPPIARRIELITLALSTVVFDYNGRNIADAVDCKMGINHARAWNLTGDGHGYHVKPS